MSHIRTFRFDISGHLFAGYYAHAPEALRITISELHISYQLQSATLRYHQCCSCVRGKRVKNTPMCCSARFALV